MKLLVYIYIIIYTHTHVWNHKPILFAHIAPDDHLRFHHLQKLVDFQVQAMVDAHHIVFVHGFCDRVLRNERLAHQPPDEIIPTYSQKTII